MTVQFSRELSTADLPNLMLLEQSSGGNDPNIWAPQVVPLTVQVKGALVLLIPTQAVQHGVSYSLQTVLVNGASPDPVFSDTNGNKVSFSQALKSYAANNSLLANITTAASEPMLIADRPTTLSATSSESANGIVSYEWTQLAGAKVILSDPNKASTSVTLANTATNSDISATVQLKITDSTGQVEYARKVISTVADPANSAYLYYRSDPGEPIGQGKTFTSVAIKGSFEEGDPSHYLSYAAFNMPNPSWLLILNGGDGLAIHVGSYENTVRPLGASGANNGLDFGADGSGCNAATGRFDVLDVAYDTNGHVARLAVDFEMHCDGRQAGLYGSFRYHSALPIKP